MPGKLGVLAGGGPLPRQIVEHCRRQGREVFVVAFRGQTDPATVDGEVAHLWTRLGAAGPTLKALRTAGCRDLVMAGPVRRPSFGEVRPDLTAARFLGRLGTRALGDDGLLRAVMDLLEREGFRMVGLHEVLPDVLAGAGVLGRHAPDDAAFADIRRGLSVAHALGQQDVGQAVVVQQGMVLGLEAIEGTDRLLARCAELRRPGPGGVLVKIKKPQQDARADLPTIGTRTVEGARTAGLRGIAVSAQGALMVDPEDTIAAADAAGLFVYGVDDTGVDGALAG
ncbi:UDP-2,3-diacylglucosamine pyrophosphatase [Rhodovibrio sodomensis]|uniref:UDP-2,3-diacylglucosamine pyrophosphatase n=1 Tax=Rhodovibrio sodomensis TaxID=1088 RepID=A0ABS1DIC9_9PROT|nr:UDP-2,3-diacylglucosamine diphosphatase LpxI [Rhodovibrio sodomensis]MBK1669140.1 UDP-2,3-diacylglucosamine pyrophosphatase [Rhodovibrio sodomensis]